MNDNNKIRISWHCYKIVFRLLSSLHIGLKKMENIQYTRRYVPAKTIWGALTATIAKRQNNRDYEAIGNFIKTNLRISYFYLSENAEGTNPSIPLYEGDLKFGNYTKADFERKFLDSYASTAVLPIYYSAEEESLHELEILTNNTKEENSKPVFLIGYIFEKIDIAGNYKWKDAINFIQIGGERKYGFGRLKLASFHPINTDSKLFDLYDIELNKKNPRIKLTVNTLPFPGHVTMLKNTNSKDDNMINKICKITGENEVLVYRETSEANRFGSNVTEALLCYCPGCIGFEGELDFSESLIMDISLNDK